MTDIIKNFPEKSSSKMMSFLKNNKKLEIENCQIFTEELSLLKSHQPKIIAFGNDAFSILQRNFENKFDIMKVPHYANYINKEKYRELLLSLCKNVNV